MADTPEELAKKFAQIPNWVPTFGRLSEESPTEQEVPTLGQDPAGLDMWIETKEGNIEEVHGYTPQYLDYNEMKKLEEESSNPFMKLWNNAQKNLPPGTVVPVPGPPGPMGPQGEKGEPGMTRLVLPPGNYTAAEVNKLIQQGNHSGITLSEGSFHVSGSGLDTVITAGEVPTAKAHPSAFKPGKKPQDHQKKQRQDKSENVWYKQQLENQQELIERATKMLEDKVLVIQVLEAQVDDMRRVNERQTKRIDDLLKVVADHDDRINWLET